MPRRPLIRPPGPHRSWRRRALIVLLCCLIVLPITPALAMLIPLNASLSTPQDPALVTNHSMALTDLTPGTDYAYQVRSCDAVGNCTLSPLATFQTLAQLPAGTAQPTVAGVPYSAKASVAPALVAPGQTATISVVVTSSTARSMLIDAEVYSSSGRMAQLPLDNQPFTAGQTRTFSFTWVIPATVPAGTYPVKVGLFTPGWATMLFWTDTAGTLAVGTPPPTATATAGSGGTPVIECRTVYETRSNGGAWTTAHQSMVCP